MLTRIGSNVEALIVQWASRGLGRVRQGAGVGAVIVGIAATASAQQNAPPNVEAVERDGEPGQPAAQDRLRPATLVGADDDPTIAYADGELLPLTRRRGCLPPVTRAGLIKVDCTVSDGPAYYFDASTRAMIEACSFWFPDLERCPPKQWPVDVPGCDAEVPRGIAGTWRLHALPTAGGFSPVDNGWAMTLTDESIAFVFEDDARFERAYAVLEHRDRQYSLELRDAQSATTRIDVELAPCGLFVESAELCDAFCANLANEVGVPTERQIRDAAARIAGGQEGDNLERIVAAMRESIERGPKPIFLERAFFKAAGVQ
jgi:hypothetical protein